MAEQFIAAFPNTPQMSQANRAFLRRAVEYLVGEGVRQFLDIGSGIPTVGHVHEIAQRAAPESRVMFVDIDPVAVEHTRLMLADNPLTDVVQQDARRPERILEAPEVQQLLDFTQPVAVLMVGLFHFVSDEDDPARIVSTVTQPLVAGSYLAISHLTGDGPRDMSAGKELSQRAGAAATLRSRQQVEALFSGFDLVEPGVVWVPQWRPESDLDLYYDTPELSGRYGGVGRKR